MKLNFFLFSFFLLCTAVSANAIECDVWSPQSEHVPSLARQVVKLNAKLAEFDEQVAKSDSKPVEEDSLEQSAKAFLSGNCFDWNSSKDALKKMEVQKALYKERIMHILCRTLASIQKYIDAGDNTDYKALRVTFIPMHKNFIGIRTCRDVPYPYNLKDKIYALNEQRALIKTKIQQIPSEFRPNDHMLENALNHKDKVFKNGKIQIQHHNSKLLVLIWPDVPEFQRGTGVYENIVSNVRQFIVNDSATGPTSERMMAFAPLHPEAETLFSLTEAELQHYFLTKFGQTEKWSAVQKMKDDDTLETVYLARYTARQTPRPGRLAPIVP